MIVAMRTLKQVPIVIVSTLLFMRLRAIVFFHLPEALLLRSLVGLAMANLDPVCLGVGLRKLLRRLPLRSFILGFHFGQPSVLESVNIDTSQLCAGLLVRLTIALSPKLLELLHFSHDLHRGGEGGRELGMMRGTLLDRMIRETGEALIRQVELGFRLRLHRRSPACIAIVRASATGSVLGV